MSKIVQAINAMISNPDNITDVMWGVNDEVFFLYKGKYAWSMKRSGSEHILWFYPGAESVTELASLEAADWEGVPLVTYRDAEIGTKEARASFAELYGLLKERVFGVNMVLDEIIKDAGF